MAKIGMRYPVYRKMTITTGEDGKESVTYGTKTVMGKAISASVSITTSEAELYADDGLAESVKEFVEGQLSISTDDLEDSVEADLLGATVSEDGIVNDADDYAPWVQVGFIISRMKGGKKQYRGVLYTKVQFAIPSEDNTTKGQTISFGTPTMTGTITSGSDGVWRKKSKWAEDAATAQSWLDTQMSGT